MSDDKIIPFPAELTGDDEITLFALSFLIATLEGDTPSELTNRRLFAAHRAQNRLIARAFPGALGKPESPAPTDYERGRWKTFIQQELSNKMLDAEIGPLTHEVIE